MCIRCHIESKCCRCICGRHQEVAEDMRQEVGLSARAEQAIREEPRRISSLSNSTITSDESPREPISENLQRKVGNGLWQAINNVGARGDDYGAEWGSLLLHEGRHPSGWPMVGPGSDTEVRSGEIPHKGGQSETMAVGTVQPIDHEQDQRSEHHSSV